MSSQNLNYEGSFSVVVTKDAEMGLVPNSATVEGETIKVPEGKVRQSLGGIQFYSKGAPFCWGYNFIIAIYDSEKNVL